MSLAAAELVFAISDCYFYSEKGTSGGVTVSKLD